MADIYDNFQDQHAIAHNNWQRNFVLPYGSAYNTAHTSFMKTIQAQEAADKAARERNLQIALFALSLCGGSILTSVFGSAVLKEVAGSVAVDVICKNEMERAFRVAAFVESNKTAQFALGKVWDEAESLIGNQLKSSFTENANNFPSLAKFVQEPQNVQNSLEMWVRDAYDRVMRAGNKINQNFSSDSDRKKQALQKLMSSQFFISAPAQRINEQAISIDIELTFFMKLVLDLDYLVAGYWEETGRGVNMKKVITSRTPIQKDPTSREYPNTSKYYTHGTNFETIEYKQIGDIIAKRINELHKSRFNSNFFGVSENWLGMEKIEKVSHSALQRAQTTLNGLANQNITIIQRMTHQKSP